MASVQRTELPSTRILIVALFAVALAFPLWLVISANVVPPGPVVVARPSDAAAPVYQQVEPDATTAARTPVPPGVVLGRVSLLRSDGVREGVAATLSWLVAASDPPTASDLAAAPKSVLPADGSFVLEKASPGTLYCVAEHVDGVASYAKSAMENDAFVSIVLPAAGKVRLLLPGNSEPFTLLLTPGRLGDDTGPTAAGRMQVNGYGEAMSVGGIPLGWGAVRLAVLFRSGARIDVQDAVPLRFREWSLVTVHGAATSCSLYGSVENEQGEPVADARVHVVRRAPDAAAYVDQDADSAGSFRVEALLHGPHVVQVSAPGYVSTSERILLAYGESRDLGIRVLSRGATVRGRVICDRPAAIAVSLVAFKDNSDITIVSRRSYEPDPDGRYVFENVRIGRWIVAMHARDPQLWTTAWSGQSILVTEADRELIVPDLSGPAWREASIRLDAPGITNTAGWKAVARGVESIWCSYGRVGPQRTISLQNGPGPFLLGLAVPSTGGGPGLVWCGVFDENSQVCRVPDGRLVFDCRRATVKQGYIVTVIYRGGAGWPASSVPVSSETLRVNLFGDEWVVEHLPVGRFDVRIELGDEVRTVPASIVTRSQMVRCVWPF
jgi:hypothetical protein